jgi:hypothetical protein
VIALQHTYRNNFLGGDEVKTYVRKAIVSKSLGATAGATGFAHVLFQPEDNAAVSDSDELKLVVLDFKYALDGPDMPEGVREEILLGKKAVEDVEKAFVLNALERNNWNVTRAADDVGMLRPNFRPHEKVQPESKRRLIGGLGRYGQAVDSLPEVRLAERGEDVGAAASLPGLRLLLGGLPLHSRHTLLSEPTA